MAAVFHGAHNTSVEDIPHPEVEPAGGRRRIALGRLSGQELEEGAENGFTNSTTSPSSGKRSVVSVENTTSPSTIISKVP
ncbi:MAG: hypothetical protein QF369_02110 [Dehalococcoidales bacterium]|nr:hypothetical protein [Dehalococcoidales bacterium]